MCKRRVTIQDVSCELETLLEIYDTDTIETLIGEYCIAAKRALRSNCYLSLIQNIEQELDKLDLNLTIYQVCQLDQQHNEGTNDLNSLSYELELFFILMYLK